MVHTRAINDPVTRQPDPTRSADGKDAREARGADSAGDQARMLDSLEAERSRLYRDIHDGPAQILANAVFEVEYVQRVAEREAASPALRAALADLAGGFRASLDSVRALIYDLRPPALSSLGLAEALRGFAGEYESRYGFSVACHLDTAETGLGATQELTVYRVAQEALQNIHKHSFARSVSLVWQRAPGGWQLRCTDDGVGFDPEAVARQSARLGLQVMRERAELVGGTLSVLTTPGRGTTVTLLIPAREGAS